MISGKALQPSLGGWADLGPWTDSSDLLEIKGIAMWNEPEIGHPRDLFIWERMLTFLLPQENGGT